MSGFDLRELGHALRVVHPAPSVIVASAVAVLALNGGASVVESGMLAMAMLGFQFSIGTLNDIADADADRLAGVDKPIPGGLVSPRWAGLIAGLGVALGIALSAGFGLAVVVLGVAGWSCGVAYDVALRRAGLGWLAFAVALPLLLAWTWTATGSFPAGWSALLLVSAVAGPMLHLSNSLVDPESDERTGRRTLATALGPRRARRTLGLLVALVLVLALVASVTRGSMIATSVAAFLLGAVLASVGVALAWAPSPRPREAGWLLLAVSMIPIVAAWVMS
ncbi:MAG: UbiA family prenyltransferase [Candidatus Limnocylindrales bacterium]